MEGKWERLEEGEIKTERKRRGRGSGMNENNLLKERVLEGKRRAGRGRGKTITNDSDNETDFL